MTTQLLDRRSLGWDVTVAASHNSNRVASLGVDGNGLPNKTIGTGSVRDSVGFAANGYFLRPYHYSDANSDGIIQQGEVVVDTGVVYKAYSQPRDLVSVQSGFDFLQRKLRITVLLDYKGGSDVLNNSALFICQQSPKACQEDQDDSLPLWQQARAVAANYGTVVDRNAVHDGDRVLRERSVLAPARAVGHAATARVAGDAPPGARRQLYLRRAQSPRVDEVHRHRSGVELHVGRDGHQRRRQRFPDAAAEVVLHASPQSSLLTSCLPENDFICRDTRAALAGRSRAPRCWSLH